MRKIFLIITAIVFIGGGFYLYNVYVNKTAFNSQASELYSLSKPIDKKVDFKELEKLPKPVKEYFYNVLKDGSDYISYFRLKHTGAFKASLKSDWSSIHGTGYYSTQTPGFIWQGRIPLMVATDRYINAKGGLEISVLDFITYADIEGFEYNKSEFIRWVTEALLYPTALLPNEMIQWEAIDDNHAKLIANYKNIKVSINVFFKNGLITKMTTNRHMGGSGYKKWVVEVNEYKWFDNYKIPVNLKASWRLEDQLFTYANFYVTKAEYNKPEIF